ncbi:hypothetical protein CEXT_815421 [Caerostris extrusa]|uniref:Uncharacterized protein n=1 Tax=Caerostris extrusa TaxID=172846 RepID=A0AAV4TZ44_CAEEX|nr:hypothetical protein CEXT_815421 [Caerostris extrusa]
MEPHPLLSVSRYVAGFCHVNNTPMAGKGINLKQDIETQFEACLNADNTSSDKSNALKVNLTTSLLFLSSGRCAVILLDKYCQPCQIAISLQHSYFERRLDCPEERFRRKEK